MGRQLAFWKYEDGIYLNNQEIYQKSCGNGETVSGLAELPIEAILGRAKKVFREYERLDDYNYGGLEGSFTIYAQPQSVVFDCSFRMSDNELNKIIDLMAEFGYPYYDPQIEVRFDGK